MLNDQNTLIQTGIVSEIRVATLLRSENEHLKPYLPCQVVVHVMERDVCGGLNVFTVNTGKDTYVRAKKAEFMEMSEVLPFRYQKDDPKDILEKYNAAKADLFFTLFKK